MSIFIVSLCTNSLINHVLPQALLSGANVFIIQPAATPPNRTASRADMLISMVAPAASGPTVTILTTMATKRPDSFTVFCLQANGIKCHNYEEVIQYLVSEVRF